MKNELIYCTQDRMRAARDAQYWTGRWTYYKAAVDMLRASVKKGPVLEVGPYTCPLVTTAVYMDITDHGVGAVRHDAGRPDWPFFRLEFEAVVALQVVEHLQADGPAVFFKEACRVTRGPVLISVPWKWRNHADHGGVDENVLLRWTNGIRWRQSGDPIGSPDRQRMLFVFSSADLRTRM